MIPLKTVDFARCDGAPYCWNMKWSPASDEFLGEDIAEAEFLCSILVPLLMTDVLPVLSTPTDAITLSLKCLWPLIRWRFATDDFLHVLAAAYMQSFWLLMGGWTVNIFLSENQISKLSRHSSTVTFCSTWLSSDNLHQTAAAPFCIWKPENIQLQIPLHDMSHRAVQYAHNFLGHIVYA